MFHTIESNPYLVTADALLDASVGFDGHSTPERYSRIDELSTYLVRLFLVDGEATPLVSSEALHGAAMLACVPSLKQTAGGKQHTYEVATQVTDNLQDVAEEIIRANLAECPSNLVVGKLSEVSVLGAMWWSVANGYFHEDSYAHLESSRHDKGTLEGRRNGFDISFREGGQKPRRYRVQVKTTHSKRVDNSYDPRRIKVVTPSDFMPASDKRLSSTIILRALANGNKHLLNKAANRARIVFPKHD
jgi:hypothetical protein